MTRPHATDLVTREDGPAASVIDDYCEVHMTHQNTGPTVLAVSGNPRPGSRTLTAAETLARRVAALVGAPDVETIDLASLAGEILGPEHAAADAARERLASATVAVVATPVYKASYTGLLKAFLDLYGPDGLAGVVVGPTRAVAGAEARLADLGPVADTGLAREGDALHRAVTPPDPGAGATPDRAVADAFAGAAR